jgi:2,3-bisphosphoglycerate-independent phosphoglycerate mutase
MKYVVVLPDGVSDVPLNELDGKTPLEAARHPHMDWIASEGLTGWAHTIPQGFAPGSDVGCMSVFGYDPAHYHTGRAPLEAAAQGIVLSETDVAFRCNTVTVRDGVMEDYSAGHIETPESAELIKTANQRLARHGLCFYPGVGYRHLAIFAGKSYAKATCTPPHDISGKPIRDYLPTGAGSDFIRRIMEDSVELLKMHEVNRRRIEAGKRPATMLWLWGQGTATQFPPFRQQYGVTGSCISAVDIVRGLARLAGLDVLQVPGITGYFDTNYEGKADHALAALDQGADLVIVHVESTDEAGHMGDAQKKIQAIEDVDRRLVGRLLDGLRQRGQPFAALVVPDHPTSTALRTHIAEPVPFALCATGGPKDAVSAYNESAVKASAKRFERGFELMGFFLNQGKT